MRGPAGRACALVLLSAIFATCGDEPRRPSKEAMRKPARAPAPAARPDRATPTALRFVDATAESGLRHQQVNGASGGFHLVETLGSGAIFFDADGDDDQDLYLLSGHDLEKHGVVGPPSNALFLNDGSGRFTEATAAARLADGRYSVGVCGGDYDNDGDVDLYVTNFDAPNALFRNDGAGHFEDVAPQAGVGGGGGCDSCAAFGDIDG